MADLHTCPRCQAAGTAAAWGPETCELWVEWTLYATFDPDEPAGPGDGHVHRWRVACPQGHVLALSDDHDQADDEQHAPPTRDQLAQVGAIVWQYDRATHGWVRAEGAAHA